MNSRVYCKDKYIAFEEEVPQGQDNQQMIHFQGKLKDKDLDKIREHLVDEKDNRNILVSGNKMEDVIRALRKKFHYIEAAGGFIEKDGRYLCIHRLGRWDLPKGKLEKGESTEEGAIRECEEECGIRQLSIHHRLRSSFHVYPYKKDYALKQSYWFYMHSTDGSTLTPQVEENIDEARWFSREDIIKTVLNDTYFTIHDVISEALGL